MPGFTKIKSKDNNENYIEKILDVESKDNFDYNKILLFLSL